MNLQYTYHGWVHLNKHGQVHLNKYHKITHITEFLKKKAMHIMDNVNRTRCENLINISGMS